MKKDDNIEDLFKDKFKNFEADVNPSVWKNVQTALKGFGLGILIKGLINKVGTSTIVAVVSSAATVIGTVLVMNWTGDKKTETVENKPETTQAAAVEIAPDATANNNVAKEEVKPVVSSPIAEKSRVVSESVATTTTTVKKDKKEIESVINKYSGKPIADIFASPVSVTVASPVSLMNNGTGKINKWTFGDSKQVDTETSPVHFYNVPGIYTVKLISTNAEGKTAVDSVKIEVLGNSNLASSIPADFSPNGDNHLDEFAFKLGENIVHHSAIIFDNKGNPVFEKEGKEKLIIWDGKDKKGKEVKVGMYFYIYNAEGIDGKKYERQGSINLTR